MHDITALGQHTQSATSDVACHHHPWTAHTVGRRLAWHDITALGQYTRSDYVGRDITSPSLKSTHGRTTLGVACHHRLLAAQTVERRRTWHGILALGRQTRSDDVRRYIPSPPLDSTHGRQMSGVALHHRPWTARMVGRRRAWYDITALRRHTRSNDVGCDMPSPPLDNTLSRTTSGVA